MQRTRTLAALVLTLVAALVGAGCNADSCARFANYRNCATVSCSSCRNDHCSAYLNAFYSAQCADDRTCVGNCLGLAGFAGPDAYCNQGDTTRCNCSENCLHTQACADAFQQYFACGVQYCESTCQ